MAGLSSRIVDALAARGVLHEDEQHELDDAGVAECDHDMVEEEEEEEEVVEVDEAEVLRALDALEPPLQVCRRLFHSPPDASAQLRVLTADALAALHARGWAVLRPAAFSDCDAATARDEALGLFRDAGSGVFGPPPSHGAFTDASARSDAIAWLRPGAPPAAGAPGLSAALACLAAVRDDLATVLRLTTVTEFQLAVYPGGSSVGYARHRDAFPDDGAAGDDQRRVTCVLFANAADWDVDRDGGALRLHVPTPDEQPPRAHVDVAPTGGTLVLFLSGAVDHEVLPCTVPRVAVSAWLH